jgi:hypothetical protein
LGNINATGTYQIDMGTVQLAATGTDELDGAGLIFGSDNFTYLTVVDVLGGPGTVTVQGPVTMAAKTITTMNYQGGNNAGDTLDVRGGTLTLAGTLNLLSSDSKPLTQPVIFFDDAGVGANMVGAFASITDSLFSAYKGNLKQNNANLWVYQVGP